MIISKSEQQKEDIKNYLPIYLETLRLDTILDFDLYIRIANEPVLYRSRILPFTEK